MSTPPDTNLHVILNIPVPFPASVNPYQQQKAIISTLFSAFQNSQNALIESPTGTGKTLALITAALVYQSSFHSWLTAAKRQSHGHGIHPDMNILHSHAFGSNTSQNQMNVGKLSIYYASRTHSQLSQALSQLKSLPFTPSARILASREYLCIHPIVSTAPKESRAGLCKVRVAKNGCEYHQGALMPKNQRMVDEKVLDIEELVVLGKKEW